CNGCRPDEWKRLARNLDSRRRGTGRHGVARGCQRELAPKRVGSTARKQMNRFANLPKTLARAMAAVLPNCRQASRLQSGSLDRKLRMLERVGLRIHLAVCKWCRRYGKQLRFLRDAAHDHPDELTEPVRPKLSDAARERIRQKLRAGEE